MLNDFLVKNAKGNPFSTESQLTKNKMWCAADNHNDTCHTCSKGFLESNLNEADINKISNFYKNCPKFHIRKNRNLVSPALVEKTWGSLCSPLFVAVGCSCLLWKQANIWSNFLILWLQLKLGHRYYIRTLICWWGQRSHIKVKGHLKSSCKVGCYVFTFSFQPKETLHYIWYLLKEVTTIYQA